MGELFITAAAGFVCVFTLGFQSRNVNHGNYGWAAATSIAVGMSQALLWKHVQGTAEAVVYSLSGSLGILTSMYVHKRWVQGGESSNSVASSAI